jgi:hypothetical protein
MLIMSMEEHQRDILCYDRKPGQASAGGNGGAQDGMMETLGTNVSAQCVRSPQEPTHTPMTGTLQAEPRALDKPTRWTI